MKPEIIDWSSVESVFIRDEAYESFKAPKWVDLSAPDELIDDEAWFCSPDCKHPKSADDFNGSARTLKGKLLRSLSVSEVLPFRGRSQRDVKLKGGEIKPPSAAKLRNMRTKSAKCVSNVNEEIENKNPTNAARLPTAPCKCRSMKAPMTQRNEKKKHGDVRSQDSSRHDVKPQLKIHHDTMGKEILNQITEFCTEMKNLAKRGRRKKISGNSGLTVRERMPLIVRAGDHWKY